MVVNGVPTAPDVADSQFAYVFSLTEDRVNSLLDPAQSVSNFSTEQIFGLTNVATIQEQIYLESLFYYELQAQTIGSQTIGKQLTNQEDPIVSPERTVYLNTMPHIKWPLYQFTAIENGAMFWIQDYFSDVDEDSLTVTSIDWGVNGTEANLSFDNTLGVIKVDKIRELGKFNVHVNITDANNYTLSAQIDIEVLSQEEAQVLDS